MHSTSLCEFAWSRIAAIMQSHLFFNEEACTFDEVQAIFFVYVALLAKLTLQSTLSLALSPLLLWNQNKENPQGK